MNEIELMSSLSEILGGFEGDEHRGIRDQVLRGSHLKRVRLPRDDAG